MQGKGCWTSVSSLALHGKIQFGGTELPLLAGWGRVAAPSSKSNSLVLSSCNCNRKTTENSNEVGYHSVLPLDAHVLTCMCVAAHHSSSFSLKKKKVGYAHQPSPLTRNLSIFLSAPTRSRSPCGLRTDCPSLTLPWFTGIKAPHCNVL